MIAKREGQLERFEPPKPRRCLAAAMKACNRDLRLADALAGAVALHLRDWSAAGPPSSDYIFRCLRTALVETGMEDVAQHLVLHRRRRASQRRGLSVFDVNKSHYALAPWRKAAVAATLEGRHGLTHAVARILRGLKIVDSRIGPQRTVGLGIGRCDDRARAGRPRSCPHRRSTSLKGVLNRTCDSTAGRALERHG